MLTGDNNLLDAVWVDGALLLQWTDAETGVCRQIANPSLPDAKAWVDFLMSKNPEARCPRCGNRNRLCTC